MRCLELTRHITFKTKCLPRISLFKLINAYDCKVNPWCNTTQTPNRTFNPLGTTIQVFMLPLGTILIYTEFNIKSIASLK